MLRLYTHVCTTIPSRGRLNLFLSYSSLSTEDVIVAEGIVKESLPNAVFRVRLTTEPFDTEEGYEILARIGGRLKKNSIRVIIGDQVRVEISPYDLTRGRIVYRFTSTS